MSELKIIVELCPEDRGRLDAILAELKEARPNCEHCVEALGDAWTKATAARMNAHPADAVPPAEAADVVTPVLEEKPAQPAPGPAAKAPDPFPAPAPAAEAPVYSLADVRRAVMGASRQSQEMKAQVKALVNEYAEGVTAMKAEDYPAFMERLGALCGGGV